jgi:hypothetical protein
VICDLELGRSYHRFSLVSLDRDYILIIWEFAESFSFLEKFILPQSYFFGEDQLNVVVSANMGFSLFLGR